MNDFEKVEKLRERANVSYEEAKAALEAANGDILDAMILLESQGKTQGPNNSSYSTKYESADNLPMVVDEAANAKSDREARKAEFVRKFKAFFRKLCVNYLVIERKEEKIIQVPLWLFILVVILGIHFIPVIIVITLLFGVRYSFVGENEMKAANDAAKKAEKVAGDVVESIKEEYRKL